MGFCTFVIMACWKRTSRTNPVLCLAHVFILRPFWVFLNVTALTVTFSTPASLKSLPRLPMLKYTEMRFVFVGIDLNYYKVIKIDFNLIIYKPNAMARTTSNVFNPQVWGSWTNWDAVISGTDLRVQDCDSCRQLDVNAICVRAIAWSQNFYSLKLYVVTSVDYYMEHLTI